jgi:multidrug efflux pump subunit AcrA (membrane-fusion protein)
VEKQHTAQLEAARDQLALARRTVHSPINGVVVSRHKSAGEYVEGDPIVELAQLDPLRISVVVPITMFGQIQVGMQATVLPELPIAGSFVATVTSMDAMMDAATATLSVRLSLPNPDHRLPSGLRYTLVLHPMVEPIADVGSGTDADAAIYSTSTQAFAYSRPAYRQSPMVAVSNEARWQASTISVNLNV